MTALCPHRPSGRHRWLAISGRPLDHRECRCGATAKIDNLGRTVPVDGMPLRSAG